jgi:hypothetical protein
MHGSMRASNGLDIFIRYARTCFYLLLTYRSRRCRWPCDVLYACDALGLASVWRGMWTVVFDIALPYGAGMGMRDRDGMNSAVK